MFRMVLDNVYKFFLHVLQLIMKCLLMDNVCALMDTSAIVQTNVSQYVHKTNNGSMEDAKSNAKKDNCGQV